MAHIACLTLSKQNLVFITERSIQNSETPPYSNTVELHNNTKSRFVVWERREEFVLCIRLLFNVVTCDDQTEHFKIVTDMLMMRGS